MFGIFVQSYRKGRRNTNRYIFFILSLVMKSSSDRIFSGSHVANIVLGILVMFFKYRFPFHCKCSLICYILLLCRFSKWFIYIYYLRMFIKFNLFLESKWRQRARTRIGVQPKVGKSAIIRYSIGTIKLVRLHPETALNDWIYFQPPSLRWVTSWTGDFWKNAPE